MRRSRPQERLRETTRHQLSRLLLATTAEVAIVHDASSKGLRDLKADLLIDGLLGYSAKGAPRETLATIIDAANASQVPLLAVDLPPRNRTGHRRHAGRSDPGRGHRDSRAPERQRVTTYGYDANALVTSVQQKPDPVGSPTLVYTTQIGRDPNGNVTQTTQPNAVITNYSYDEDDSPVSYSTHPDGQTTLTTTFVLDGNGLPLTRTTPDGQITTNAYDPLSRLTSIAATGMPTIAYQYDASGNRTQMTDSSGTTTYQFDGLGRVTATTQPGGALSYVYDRDGNRLSVTYPASVDTVTYVYTLGGLLDHLIDSASRTSTYTYTASGLAKTLLAPQRSAHDVQLRPRATPDERAQCRGHGDLQRSRSGTR